MNEEDNKDVNAEETGEDPSASEETTSEESESADDSTGEDAIKSADDEAEEVAEELLADGTPADKEIRVKKTKYDEQAEKAKLYDSFSPLLSRLNKNPEVLDRLLEDKKETLEQRVRRLEEEKKVVKQAETKNVITQAVKTWSDFREKWDDIRPIVTSLENRGISYAEAVQRAYFAVSPEAVQDEARLVSMRQAESVQNSSGKTSSSGTKGKVVHEERDTVHISDADREFADKAGISLDLYKKHAKHLEQFKDL